MEPILLQIPPEVAMQLKIPPKMTQKVLMEELVIRLYQEGIISSGHGSYLLKMDRLDFERFLAQHEVAIHCGTEELTHDLSCINSVL